MRNLGTTLTSNVRNPGVGTVAATLLILLLVVNPAPASAGTFLDRALEIAAAKAFRAGQGAAATSTECLLAANAGTTEGGSEASFRYFGNGLIMPFYAVGKARQSPRSLLPTSCSVTRANSANASPTATGTPAAAHAPRPPSTAA